MNKCLALALLLVFTGCSGQPTVTTTVTPTPAATVASTPKTPVTTTPTPSATETSNEAGFQKTLTLQDHTFDVSTSKEGNQTVVTVVVTAPEMEQEPLVSEIDGTVTGADTEDLNSDGYPEVYVYAVSNSPQKEGILVAYSSNKGKSASQISIPELSTVEGAAEGYEGQDEFQVLETNLVQRYPVESEEVETRQVQWKLEPGEASWVLVPDKVVNF